MGEPEAVLAAEIPDFRHRRALVGIAADPNDPVMALIHASTGDLIVFLPDIDVCSQLFIYYMADRSRVFGFRDDLESVRQLEHLGQ